MAAQLDYPPEFATSIRTQAESDAEAVIGFLYALNLISHSDGNKQISFSAEGLLGIALALRFRRLELLGIHVHTDAGLPTSDQVFDRVRSLVQGPELKKFVDANWMKAIRVYHDSFLWSAVECDLAVDIAIVADEDEQFLDAIADFLISVSSDSTAVGQ